MVLRGAQSQRSGRAGCVFLTRRAFSSFHARFMQEQSDALYLPQEGRLRVDIRRDSTAESSAGNLTKDSRRPAREG